MSTEPNIKILHNDILSGEVDFNTRDAQLPDNVNTMSRVYFDKILHYDESITEINFGIHIKYYPTGFIDMCEMYSKAFIVITDIDEELRTNKLSDKSLNTIAVLYENAMLTCFDNLKAGILNKKEDWLVSFDGKIKREDSINAIKPGLVYFYEKE